MAIYRKPKKNLLINEIMILQEVNLDKPKDPSDICWIHILNDPNDANHGTRIKIRKTDGTEYEYPMNTKIGCIITSRIPNKNKNLEYQKLAQGLASYAQEEFDNFYKERNASPSRKEKLIDIINKKANEFYELNRYEKKRYIEDGKG